MQRIMEQQKREQRIKLRCKGSPVKFDATIIKATPNGKAIVVRFDGPLDDLELWAFGEREMLSNMMDHNGEKTSDVRMAAKGVYWEVL